jgi:transcriptional regulator CtsR
MAYRLTLQKNKEVILSLVLSKYRKKHSFFNFFTMAVEKTIGSSSLVEVIDRILDKGVVVDAWVRVSLVGIELLAIEARVVVASVETYLKYAEAIGLTAKAA